MARKMAAWWRPGHLRRSWRHGSQVFLPVVAAEVRGSLYRVSYINIYIYTHTYIGILICVYIYVYMELGLTVDTTDHASPYMLLEIWSAVYKGYAELSPPTALTGITLMPFYTPP